MTISSEQKILTRLGISEKYHFWVYIMLALLAVRFVAVPLITWQNERLENIAFLGTQIREPQKLDDYLTRLNQELSVLNDKLDATADYYRTADKPKDSELQLAREVEQLAQNHQLNVTSKDWGTVYDEGSYVRQYMQLRMEGYYEQVQSFLIAVEANIKPFFFVTELRIDRASGTGKVTVNVTVHQLFLKSLEVNASQ